MIIPVYRILAVTAGLFLLAITNVVVSQEQPGEQVVIELGTQSVTMDEYDRLFDVAVRMLAAQQGLAFGEQKPEQLSMLRKQYLNQRSSEMSLIQEAKRRNITVTDADVREQFDDYLSRLSADTSTNAIVDETVLLQLLKEKKLVALLSDQLLEEIEIRPGDVVVLHHDIEGQLAIPEQACLRHIVVGEREVASRLRLELESGADFAALAKDNSVDPKSAATGGDLGCLVREHIVPKSDFERAIFNSKTGDLVGPVSSAAGYHLLVVYDRKSAKTPTLNEVYKDLEKEIRHERLPDRQVQIREASGVVIYPDRLEQ